jgi:[acyl-carrier-protein] S-malonyltransferase
MTIGYIFPGQGSQYIGMGKDLYQNFNDVKRLYDEAEELLGFPLKKICFDGPESELRQTRYTQPAIFIHSLALLYLLKSRNIHPMATAGHSLGEYSALVAAGAISLTDGLKIVSLRAEEMQKSGEKNPGTMAAIIGLSSEDIEEICQEASAIGIVKAANFNSPGQIVISGAIASVHKAMELARQKKARLVTELVVSGAFHSPLMQDALDGLTSALDKLEIKNPIILVYPNVTAQPTKNPSEIRDLLKRQLLSPVLWQNTVQNMITGGIDTFYEIGPGKVLQNLVKRIDAKVNCFSIGKIEDLQILN